MGPASRPSPTQQRSGWRRDAGIFVGHVSGPLLCSLTAGNTTTVTPDVDDPNLEQRGGKK